MTLFIWHSCKQKYRDKTQITSCQVLGVGEELIAKGHMRIWALMELWFTLIMAVVTCLHMFVKTEFYSM